MSDKDRLLLQLQRRSLQKTEDGQLHSASLVEILCLRVEIDRLETEIARLKIAAGEVEPPETEGIP